MIEISQIAATAVVGTVMVGTAIWGAFFSLRAALRGPEWALSALTRVTPILIAGVVLGAVVALAVRPAWLGLGVIYVAAAAWFLVVTLRRSMLRWREVGGFEGEISPERRAAVLGRARILAWFGAGLMAILGALLWPVGPVLAIPALALGAVLAVVGTRLGTAPSSSSSSPW